MQNPDEHGGSVVIVVVFMVPYHQCAHVRCDTMIDGTTVDLCVFKSIHVGGAPFVHEETTKYS